MSKPRPRVGPAATLLAAALALLTVAGPAAAAPTPTPIPTPATTPAPTTPAPTTPAPDRLPPPADLRVSAVTPNSVTLSWSPSTGDVVGYTVNYAQAFNDVFWSQPFGNVTTATITGSISATREYRFSVYARDAAGRTSLSTPTITVVTPAGTTGDTTPPSAPRDLRITEVTADGPALAWSPSTDDTGVTGYQVYFFDGWFSSTLLGTATGTTFVAPFRSSSLPSPSYYVRARDAAGNLSIASPTVRAPIATTTTPPPARTCRVAYRTTAEWTGGFVAEVTVTNTGTAPVDGWTLAFTAGGDQQVTSAWHATVSQAGAEVTLTAAGWNRTIAPGGSVTAGLIGRWTSGNAPPTSATLNGSACTLV